MGLAHDSNDRDLHKKANTGYKRVSYFFFLLIYKLTHPARRPDRSRLQFGQQSLFIIIRNSTDDIHQPRNAPISMFLANLGANFIQGDGFVSIVCFYELCSNPGSDSEK